MSRVMKGRWALKPIIKDGKPRPFLVEIHGAYRPAIKRQKPWKGWYEAEVVVSYWPFRISYYELATYYDKV